jgi:hypothetical protein
VPFPRRTRELTAARWRQVDEIRAEWRAVTASTASVDRDTAERAIGALYRAHGWAPPRIVWAGSPLTGMLAVWLLAGGGSRFDTPPAGRPYRDLLSSPVWETVGEGWRDRAYEAVRQAYGAAVAPDETLRNRLRDPAAGAAVVDREVATIPGASRVAGALIGVRLKRRFPLDGYERRSLVGSGRQADAPLELAVRGAVHPRLRARIGDPYAIRRPDRYLMLGRAGLEAALGHGRAEGWPLDDLVRDRFSAEWRVNPFRADGKVDASWVGTYDLYRRVGLVCYRRRHDAMLDLLADVSRACGWWWPHPLVCVVADRPAQLHAQWDAAGELRPHRADGPAIVWRDGWELHAWRGTPVPPAVAHARITVDDWLGERNAEVRRAMAERMGYGWLLDRALAVRVATDEWGTLWRVPVGDGDDIALVDVLNSTPEPDGSVKRYVLRVPPEQQVPRDAIGWTFGLGPGEYSPTVMS